MINGVEISDKTVEDNGNNISSSHLEEMSILDELKDFLIHIIPFDLDSLKNNLRVTKVLTTFSQIWKVSLLYFQFISFGFTVMLIFYLIGTFYCYIYSNNTCC